MDEFKKELQVICNANNLYIQDNQGEGNCQFESLADQIAEVLEKRLSHVQVRAQIMAFLKDHPFTVRMNLNTILATLFRLW